MLEAYTALGALATATEKVLLGTLVTAEHVSQSHSARQDHHHPRRDQSGPRGAGDRTAGSNWSTTSWATNSAPHRAVRQARRGPKITLLMIRHERVTFSGEYYKTEQALAAPPPRPSR